MRRLGYPGSSSAGALSVLGGYARELTRASLWVVSIACMALALLVAPLIRRIDEITQWRLLGFGVEGARAVVSALSASMLSFIVFIFSILLLVVQVAGAQLSPRVISRPFERGLTKTTLGVFVFAYAFSLTALGRIEGHVPQLAVLVAVLASLISIALFLYLIQSIGVGFRPTSVLTNVADATADVIEALYPAPFAASQGATDAVEPGGVTRTLQHRGRSGIVVAFDIPALVALAERADCRIALIPEVGEFIASGDELCSLHGPPGTGAAAARLERCVTIAPEQTIEQDPLFGIRIIVDVALKALSPGINDSGTGTAAIDQLHHLLSLVGHRELDDGIARDSAGEVRVLYRATQWEDFVALAIAELHAFVGAIPQVNRRFRAMVAHLVRTLPEPRARYLRGELERLDRTAEEGAPQLPGRRSLESFKRASP